MGIINLLASSNYMIVNKVIARKFGIESAVLLGELCSWQQYYNNEEFAKDKSTLINSTCLTEYAFNNAIKVLKENNILQVTKKGLPAKNYYYINEDVLNVHLTSDVEINTTRQCENETSISNNNNINNTSLNNNISNNTLKENINTKESNDMAITCHSTTATKSVKECKHKYGEYKNVLLTDTELSKLQNEYGETETQNAITYLDEYIEMKGAKYKSHYLAIRKWVFDALKRHKKEEEKGNSMWETLNKVFEDDE